jgi:3-oxoacyl-[acyl-carrier-protein] synthase-3
MNQVFEHLTIEAISSCVPSRVISNESLQDLLNPKERKFFEKTVGILERRWVENNTTASDLGFKAAQQLIDKKSYDIKKIKVLIFLSQTADYKIPFTSNILQSRLGLSSDTLCLDINAGCAGFVQGLSIGFALAQTLRYDEKVLFIVSETLSKILSPSDRSTTILFGDAGSAIIIGKSDQASNSYINIFSDGSNYDAIMIQDGGYRNCVNENSHNRIKDDNNNLKSRLDLSMDGSRVFDFTLREVAPSIKALLADNNIDIQSINFFLLHQSNKFIIKQITSKLEIAEEKVLINIDKYGNTSGVSIPLLISSYQYSFKSSNYVLFSGYGSGLNWGNCVTDISNTDILPLIEY